MKIGILTLPLNINYGGILQAYALQTVLERMGHNVHLIEIKKKPFRMPLWKAPFAFGKRIMRNLSGQRWPIFYERKMNREVPIIEKNTNTFIRKYIKSKIVGNYSNIREDDFDIIIVGSDQIFRARFLHNIEHSFLDFAEGWKIKRLAYAASFGTDKWEYNEQQTKECGRLLKLFDSVSVREISGVDLCRVHFDVNADFVLDPTMLLSAEDYIRLFKEANTPKSLGNLLYYILDETSEKTQIINNIAKEKGLLPFNVKSKSDVISAPLADRIQPPVEQWLRGFYDAEFIITDSFHACVFSILFKKNFLVIGNECRGMSRFYSLLKTFSLENRLIVADEKKNLKITDIDFDSVYEKLFMLRQKSNSFLHKNIG